MTAPKPARTRIRSCDSDRRLRTRDSRTWGTSWVAPLALVALRAGCLRQVARPRARRQRPQREKLSLDTAAEPIRVRALEVGGTYGLERGERVTQMAGRRERPGTGQRVLAAARQR